MSQENHESQAYKVLDIIPLPTGDLAFAINKDSLAHRMAWREMDKTALRQIFEGRELEMVLNGASRRFRVKDIELFSSIAGFWNVFLLLEPNPHLEEISIGDEVKLI